MVKPPSDADLTAIIAAATSAKSDHPPFAGPARMYQRSALAKWSAKHDTDPTPWSWVATTCGQPTCMRVGCMRVHHATRINYPAGVCVYCGEPSGSFDHLIPKAWTGEGVARARTAIVPACGQCNSFISDSWAVSITERRAVAHRKIERKYRDILHRPDRDPSDLAQIGHVLMSVIRKNDAMCERVRERLAWPGDSGYDIRAFQRSGISDPESLGLL